MLAAADPVGDPALILRAARVLGLDTGAVNLAAAADLLEFGANVRFRHPLVRSAAYRTAAADDRRAVHEALAAVTDPLADPDRRAWHRAHATAGPDETVAEELVGLGRPCPAPRWGSRRRGLLGSEPWRSLRTRASAHHGL